MNKLKHLKENGVYIMGKLTYIDLLALLEVEDAHPGGFNLTKQMINLLPITSDSEILEVGCGSGKTASYLYDRFKCPIITIDINERMLKKAKKRFEQNNLPIKLYRANAESLPFANETFNFIISESVTSFTNIKKSLREYVRVLNNEGYFLAIEMTTERPLSIYEQKDIENVYGISKTYTVQEWNMYFQNAGFKDIKVVYGGTIAKTPQENTGSLPIHKLSSEGINLLHLFQMTMNHYKDVLGYRVFLCKK